VIVAACLVALLVLGLFGAGVFAATRLVSAHRHEQGIERLPDGNGKLLPPGQRKKLEQRFPGNGGAGGLGGLGGLDKGRLKSLLRGAAGLGQLQHGEFTLQGADGKSTVMTVQYGTVTTSSSTSLTVKSADGFTATYTIDANTLGAPVSKLATGDTVMVVAEKSGAKAVLIRAGAATK
jgi:hypothetical protein